MAYDGDDAVAWAILDQMQTNLRTVTWPQATGESAMTVIPDAAIVIRKTTTGRRRERGDWHTEQTPGILLCCVSVRYAGGNVGEDDYYYDIVAQLIDSDDDNKSYGLRTHLRWLEQMRRLFNNSTLLSDPANDVIVDSCKARHTLNTNEKVWKRHHLFQGAVQFRFTSRHEPRVTT